MAKEWGDTDTEFEDRVEFDGDIPGEKKDYTLVLFGGIAVLVLIIAILSLVI
ncbi:MAG: hypothetical protein LC650_02600 [Actinobacteria bacterium]|nr:hypothetical protein [Actinomycetota bacterium]